MFVIALNSLLSSLILVINCSVKMHSYLTNLHSMGYFKNFLLSLKYGGCHRTNYFVKIEHHLIIVVKYAYNVSPSTLHKQLSLSSICIQFIPLQLHKQPSIILTPNSADCNMYSVFIQSIRYTIYLLVVISSWQSYFLLTGTKAKDSKQTLLKH